MTKYRESGSEPAGPARRQPDVCRLVNKPAPALTLLAPPPLTAQTSGRNFLLSRQKDVTCHSERSEESIQTKKTDSSSLCSSEQQGGDAHVCNDGREAKAGRFARLRPLL